MRTSIAVAVSVVMLGLASSACAQTIQINRENKTIAISTTDEATATADIAAITIGFQIFKPDADLASAEGGRLSHAIMDALHGAGVDDKSIESRSQSLNINHQFDGTEDAAQRALRQFTFEQSWEVTVDPKDAAQVIRLTQAAGANQSGNIDWRLADRKSLQAKASASALIKAHAVASQMAAGLSVKLGALIYASNEAPDVRIAFAASRLGVGVGGNTGGGVFSAMGYSKPLEIRPQTIRESATVYAVFAIE
jgi:uncharacterized protein